MATDFRRTSSAPVLLERARSALADAVRAPSVADRFVFAHLAALRVAAAVLAERGRPASRRRLVSAWVLLPQVAPEFEPWAAYFGAAARVRAAVEAGASSAVSQRMADDQVRAAEEFLRLAQASLGQLAA